MKTFISILTINIFLLINCASTSYGKISYIEVDANSKEHSKDAPGVVSAFAGRSVNVFTNLTSNIKNVSPNAVGLKNYTINYSVFGSSVDIYGEPVVGSGDAKGGVKK